MPAQRASHSPSPPPQAPSIETTASDPSHRAAALRKVFNAALTASLKSNSYTNFSSCFPTPAHYCPTALEGVHRQLNTRLQEECEKDFEKILEERKVVEGLNAWDGLVEEARVRKARAVDVREKGDGLAPPHLLSAEELGRAWRAPYLRRVEEETRGKLERQQEENVQMMERIRGQREEIEALVGGLEGVVRDLEESVNAMEGVDELRGMSWEMEQEVQASKG